MPDIWLVIVGVGEFDVVFARAVGVTFTGGFVGALLAATLMAFAIPYRASGRSASIADGLETIAICSVFSQVGCVLTYLAARTNRPLADAAFAAADALLGFSWPVWQAALASHPFAGKVLAGCYAAVAPEVGGVVLLAFMGYGTRARDFLWIAIFLIGLAVLITGLYPAESAPAFFGTNFSGRYFQDILILRGAAPVTFALGDLTGIISFPSYHAALAVAFVWAFRGFDWLTWAAVLLNALVIISALVSGGHYLVDLLAGTAVGVTAIVMARLVMLGALRSPSASGLSSPSA